MLQNIFDGSALTYPWTVFEWTKLRIQIVQLPPSWISFYGLQNLWKLADNRIVDHLKNCGLYFNFHYGFRSSQSNTDFLTVVSGRIAKSLISTGLLELQLFIYSRLSTGLRMLVSFNKSCGSSGKVFGLIPSLLSKRRFQVVRDGKNAGVP